MNVDRHFLYRLFGAFLMNTIYVAGTLVELAKGYRNEVDTVSSPMSRRKYCKQLNVVYWRCNVIWESCPKDMAKRTAHSKVGRGGIKAMLQGCSHKEGGFGAGFPRTSKE